MRKNKVCGLYVITHKPTGKFYIGSSSDIYGRVSHHKWALRNNRNNSTRLQEAFNSNPDVSLLDILIHPCKSREEAYDMEQKRVDMHWGNPDCLNTCKDVRNPISEQMNSDVVKEKRNASLKEVRGSLDFKVAMSEHSKKRWATDGARQSITGAGNPFAKQVKVDGVIYGSVKDAVKATGVGEKTIRKRANLTEFASYQWV